MSGTTTCGTPPHVSRAKRMPRAFAGLWSGANAAHASTSSTIASSTRAGPALGRVDGVEVDALIQHERDVKC